MLKQRAQTTKPKLKTTKSCPCTHASSLWTNATPPGRMHAKHHLKQGSCNNSALTGQTGCHHRSDWCSTCAQDQHSDRSNRWPRPVRPVHTRAQKWLETTLKPSKCIQQAISSQTSPPCWQCMNQAKNEKMQPKASQIVKIQHRMLPTSKWAS
jgi:hypothetical protein